MFFAIFKKEVWKGDITTAKELDKKARIFGR